MSEREEWSETLRKQAENTRTHLAELWEAIDHLADCDIADRDECDECATLDPEHWMPESELRETLDELPLEIVWEKGEPFAVVLGTGGPHAEITGGGRSGGYKLTVYWSGEHTVTGEAITRTGEYFRELYSEMDQ